MKVQDFPGFSDFVLSRYQVEIWVKEFQNQIRVGLLLNFAPNGTLRILAKLKHHLRHFFFRLIDHSNFPEMFQVLKSFHPFYSLVAPSSKSSRSMSQSDKCWRKKKFLCVLDFLIDSQWRFTCLSSVFSFNDSIAILSHRLEFLSLQSTISIRQRKKEIVSCKQLKVWKIKIIWNLIRQNIFS